eukprot:SAG31_NODE_3757_length_3912_cov_2.865460_4_plen_89_part_00
METTISQQLWRLDAAALESSLMLYQDPLAMKGRRTQQCLWLCIAFNKLMVIDFALQITKSLCFAATHAFCRTAQEIGKLHGSPLKDAH